MHAYCSHPHVVFRQGAGFVGAQHCRGPETFNGGGAPGQYMRTRNPPGPHRHEYRQYQRELLRQHAHAERDAGEAGFEVVSNLAEDLPTVSNDGKTYTFKLRSGIKFSDGRDVTVKDVVASFQRIFKVSSPTSGGFYSVIVGADACIATPATCTLEGGVSGDETAGTVTINLTRADPEFLFKLAVPHASILPADAPATDAGSVPLAGTGPYFFSAYDPNKGLTMSRNPHFKVWSEAAMPDGYPDVVQYDFGLTDEAEVTAVMNGEADWMFDQPPTDRLGEIGTKYKDQVYINTLTAWWYAPMNTRIAPFDNLKARQAVNYAIDRKALVNLFGGPVLAAPVCQVLPPGFPALNPIDHFIAEKISDYRRQATAATTAGVDFWKQVQPVLEARCLECHQGGKAKAGLHLDTLAGALKGGESGETVLAPGHPERSQLLQRILSRDADEQMLKQNGVDYNFKTPQPNWISSLLPIILPFLFVIGSIALIPLLPTGFIPPDDNSQTQVYVELPPGSTLKQTQASAEQARLILTQVQHVKSIYTTIGGGSAALLTKCD